MFSPRNITQLFQNFLPEDISEDVLSLSSFIVYLLVITIIFLIAKYLLEKFFDANPAGKIDFRNKQSVQRVWTINNLLRNFTMYILYFIFAYYLLSALGFPVRTLLAGAGIAGVAIGLGAQDLINDMINGFFIIFENLFEVGDLVEITGEDIVGIIKDLGIRTTTIEAANGDTYYIPNSQIAIINNKSRKTRQITIEIPVADETDFRKFEETVAKITQSITEKYDSVLQDEPSIVGFVRGADQTFNYRIAFVVSVGEDYMHTSIFYREYLYGLQEESIKIPSSVYDEMA
ncbi:mechanosensitive ion channel family protein [Aerococcaceae bacterium WGS1372]